jgi:hypothetical protein
MIKVVPSTRYRAMKKQIEGLQEVARAQTSKICNMSQELKRCKKSFDTLRKTHDVTVWENHKLKQSLFASLPQADQPLTEKEAHEEGVR